MVSEGCQDCVFTDTFFKSGDFEYLTPSNLGGGAKRRSREAFVRRLCWAKSHAILLEYLLCIKYYQDVDSTLRIAF